MTAADALRRPRRRPALLALLAAAGLGDTVTGLALVAAPEAVLRLLAIPTAGADPFALRFVGVFVGCVGLAYLYPFALAPARRGARLAAAIETTAGIRLAVAAFLVVSVATGRPAGWLVVAGVDAAIALAQLALGRGEVRLDG